MATIPNKIYKLREQSGAISYQVLPGTNTPSGMTEVTDPNEVYDYIKTLKAMPAYVAGKSRETGQWFDAQQQAKTIEAEMARYQASPDSGLVASYQAPWGETLTNVPQATIDEIEKNKAAAAAGTIQQIGSAGTAGVPLYVPTGSAGALQSQGVPIQQQLQTPSVQQQVQQQGLNPVVPQQPVQGQTMTTTAPTTPTYTVQAGDTLNAIAQKLGVNPNQITGYRSGNPNLIYPGEILTVGTGQVGGQPTTPEEIAAADKATRQGLGVEEPSNAATGQSGASGEGSEATTTPAPTDFISTYTQAMEDLGITTIKQEFEKIQKEQADLQNELNDEIAEINENPWLSEGARVKAVNAMNAKYEGKLNILTNQQKLYDSLYQEGVAQAQYMTTGSINQAIDLARIAQDKAEALSKLDSSIVEVNGRKLLIDNQTGETIKDLGIATTTDNGLTPGQINTTVNSIASAFDNEQIVKNYNIALEGYNTLKSIGTTGNNPADDIAFIYGFAKVMDPNSVVREGEYNTIQKYAQSWAESFGFKAERIFSNTKFLSTDAKNKMLGILEAKKDSVETQYKNLQTEYQRQIDDALQGKTRTITDYSKAYQDTSGISKTSTTSEVPDDVAAVIEIGLAEGRTLEEIRTDLANKLGRETGYQYLDKYMQNK